MLELSLSAGRGTGRQRDRRRGGAVNPSGVGIAGEARRGDTWGDLAATDIHIHIISTRPPFPLLPLQPQTTPVQQHPRHGVGCKACPAAPEQHRCQAIPIPAATCPSYHHPALDTRCGSSSPAFLKPLIRPRRVPQCHAASPADRGCRSIYQGGCPSGAIVCPDPDAPLTAQRPHHKTDDHPHPTHR